MFGNSKKKISEDERVKILEKIEGIYRDKARSFGHHVFNIKNFYDRYNDAIRFGEDEQNFLWAEALAIDDFEKNREEERLERLEKEKTVFGEMYLEFKKRLEKYPRSEIHPRAEQEIECLLGCLIDFDKYCCKQNDSYCVDITFPS